MKAIATSGNQQAAAACCSLMDSLRGGRGACWRTPTVVVTLSLLLLGVQVGLQRVWPSNELSAQLRVESRKWQVFGGVEKLVAVNNGRIVAYE